MRIVDESESLIHTRFVTDGEALGERDRERMDRELRALLRGLGIVAGVRFDRDDETAAVRVVLECRPGRRELEEIRVVLVRLLTPLPLRPPGQVEVERPAQGPYR